MDGCLIVFEGIDGSGKSTQLNSLYDYLKNTCSNEKVILTKEPYDGHKLTFSWIRKILDKEIVIEDRTILEFLLLLNRYHHSLWMKDLVNKGYIILCDRYYYSSIAYQELFTSEFIENINKRMLNPLLIFFVELSGKDAMDRINSRNEKKTLYEKVDKLNNANKRYKDYFNTLENVVHLNGRKDIKELEKEVLHEFRKL